MLDRTPADAVETVASHLARMLASRGLKDSPLFIVREGQVDAEGLLPPELVSDVRGWLTALAEDSGARGAVVKQTLDGAIRAMTHRVHPLADAAGRQQGLADALREDVDQAYDHALAAIDTAMADGTLLRGEVLARWQEFVGTGELLAPWSPRWVASATGWSAPCAASRSRRSGSAWPSSPAWSC